MRRTKEQKALDEELLREYEGYHRSHNKPDGAYIEEDEYFYNINKIKRLIASGADVNVKNDGFTPLHLAVGMKNIELAKLLIVSGADVRAKNKWGSTPLHLADSVELAKLLIDSGADVVAKNNDGYAPLDWATSKKMRNLLKKHRAIK